MVVDEAAAASSLLQPVVEHGVLEPELVAVPGVVAAVAAAVVVAVAAGAAVPASAATAPSEVVVAVGAAAGIEVVADFAVEAAEPIVLAAGVVAVVAAVEHLGLLVDLELLPSVMEALLVEAALVETDCFHLDL